MFFSTQQDCRKEVVSFYNQSKQAGWFHSVALDKIMVLTNNLRKRIASFNALSLEMDHCLNPQPSKWIASFNP